MSQTRIYSRRKPHVRFPNPLSLAALMVLVPAAMLVLAALTDWRTGTIAWAGWVGLTLAALFVRVAVFFYVESRHRPGRRGLRLCLVIAAGAGLNGSALAQTALSWLEIRKKFEAANPTLQAVRIGIEESRAGEITASLRPNPTFTLLTDGTQIAPHLGIWRPLSGTLQQPSFSYLHEFSYQHGGTSLLDFGAYLTAASQLNLAVGREVIP